MNRLGFSQSVAFPFLLLRTLQGLRWAASRALWRGKLTSTSVSTLVKFEIRDLEGRSVDRRHERGGDI